jgi:Tfp pilus assembly protein PilN
MWLSALKQNGENVIIEGRCTALTSLSDFVANLERTGYFKKDIEASSETETARNAATELIKFSIKAQFQQPGEATAEAGRAGKAKASL